MVEEVGAKEGRSVWLCLRPAKDQSASLRLVDCLGGECDRCAHVRRLSLAEMSSTLESRWRGIEIERGREDNVNARGGGGWGGWEDLGGGEVWAVVIKLIEGRDQTTDGWSAKGKAKSKGTRAATRTMREPYSGEPTTTTCMMLLLVVLWRPG